MIFAVVGEELGLIGSTAVIMAFGVFAWAGFRVALHCRIRSASGSLRASRPSSAGRPRSTSARCSGSRR